MLADQVARLEKRHAELKELNKVLLATLNLEANQKETIARLNDMLKPILIEIRVLVLN